MQLERGCVVRSISGRDAERFYVLMDFSGENALIADGKVHRLEKPKRKNAKHLQPTKTLLSLEHLTTNNQLRQALRTFNEETEQLSPSTKGR